MSYIVSIKREGAAITQAELESAISDETLRTMQAVAGRLNARVVGEEGEDLTNLSVPDGQASSFGCIAVLAVLAVAAYVVWWVLA